MGKLSEALKNQLKEAGQWPDFIRCRDELKATGISPKEAQTRAVDEFFKNPPKSTGQSGSRSTNKGATKTETTKTNDQETSGPGVNEPGDVGDVAVSVDNQPKVKGRLSVGYGVSNKKLKLVSPEEFEGKQAPEVEIIRWVARNMMVDVPVVEECPDATAWALLAHCRCSVMAAAEFWKTTYTKLLPSRAQMEAAQGEKETDGSKTTEVIDELLTISKKAREQCGACC